MKFENYRHYIQNEFEKRRIRNPSYSLRAFARDLSVSPSRLSEVINGKRGISNLLAQKIMEGLKIEGVDAEIFILSVEAEHSRSKRQKLLAQEQLQKAIKSSKKVEKTFTIVDWVTEALLKMNEREAVLENVGKVSVNLGVPKFMVTDSLRFLTRLGFIPGGKGFKTYLQSRGQGRKLNVDYIQILEQAQKAYLGMVSGNYFNHEAFLLDTNQIKKAELIIASALDDIRKLQSKSKKSKVVFVANQIFSVEKG